MKKNILTLVLVFFSIGAVYAQKSSTSLSLKEAFAQLAHIPNVNMHPQMDSLDIAKADTPANSVVLYGVSIAMATELDQCKVKQVGDDMYSILNTIGLQYVVNGATNNLVAGFIYANSIGENLNEILLVACTGEEGAFAVIYGTADNYTVGYLQNSPLYMVGPKLAIEPTEHNYVIKLAY